jgi:hypothetical protein
MATPPLEYIMERNRFGFGGGDEPSIQGARRQVI